MIAPQTGKLHIKLIESGLNTLFSGTTKQRNNVTAKKA